MTSPLRLPTLFVSAPMQDRPIRVALASALLGIASVAAALAL